MVYWFKSERVRSMVHHQFGANFEFRSSLLVPVRLWISFLNLTKLSISFSKTINFLSFWYLIITFNVYNSSLFQPIYWNSLASRIFSLGDWLLKNYSVKITYLVSRIFPQKLRKIFQNGSYSMIELGLEIGYRGWYIRSIKMPLRVMLPTIICLLFVKLKFLDYSVFGAFCEIKTAPFW